MISRPVKAGLSIAAMCSLLALAACGSTATPLPQSSHAAPQNNANYTQLGATTQAYRLGTGDEVRVNVFGEPDLSGQFDVDGQGGISLPLVGHVQAAGMTMRELEDAVEASLRNGYLRDPQVSVEVLNFRPFYIIGEVNAGGEFPYSHGMTVLNAVATAGGYSYRADQRKVFITRNVNGRESDYQASPSSVVLPGDVIRVPERFF